MILIPFKDIAFFLPFLRCCLSFLSFLICLSHAWTPAAETRRVQISASGNSEGRLPTTGGGGWPFCPRRTCAQVSPTRPSLCWMIWIFFLSLSQPRAASLRKGSCYFWKNLGREGCSLAPRGTVLDNDQFLSEGRRTGSVFILFTFGFLAGLAIVHRIVLKGKGGEKKTGCKIRVCGIKTVSLQLWTVAAY